MKRWIVVIALLYGGYWYASRHYDFQTALVYAKKNPSPKLAPAIDYYVGLAYYQRAEFGKSQEAFTQLLTDYPTGQYTDKALLRLSEVAMENKDYDAARFALTRFKEEFPDHPQRQIADKRYELLYNR
ncbi:MAG: outer membrane protein assembly factor BamD [Elusimicrobiota bacterium]|nr:outer membrane protein assembly factor BamD [Elusimicrobiota bacterium]